MKYKWFKRWGWIYQPVTWQGVGFVVFTMAFCVQVFMVVDRQSHSVSDTLYGIFPYFVPAIILLYWIASKTSEK